MNHLRTVNIGIDKAIYKVQNALYKTLESKGSISSYGRVYRNKRKKKFVLEVFTGNGEYEEVMGTDVSKFFFVVDERKRFDDDPQSNIEIVFMVDLSDFYPDAEERLDESFKAMVFSILDKTNFKVSDMYGHERLNTLLSSYQIGKTMEYDHLHPKLIFVVSGTLNYNLKTCI